MSKLEKFLLLFYCMLFLCSIKPYEQRIIPPVTGAAFLYQLQEQPEQERCHVPPIRNVPAQYQEMFAAASVSAGIPPGVLEAIADVESNFRPRAMSQIRDDGHRDLGMFQFNDRYHQWYSDQYNDGILFDPFDPVVSIKIAALHVLFLYERYGNWPDVFLAYNAGIGRVDNNNIPESTFNYLAKIYRSELCER